MMSHLLMIAYVKISRYPTCLLAWLNKSTRENQLKGGDQGAFDDGAHLKEGNKERKGMA